VSSDSVKNNDDSDARHLSVTAIITINHTIDKFGSCTVCVCELHTRARTDVNAPNVKYVNISLMTYTTMVASAKSINHRYCT
jgi:hypothetical protein